MTQLLPVNTFQFEDLSLEKKKLLEKHLSLVLEINKQVNLTRISSLEEGILLHIEDSLSGIPEFLNAPEGNYADLGTGAGYPGIPLSIVTGRGVLLVDSVNKKMNALNLIINKLGIENQVVTYSGRIEQLARERKEGFSLLTARALTSLSSLIELASPLLRVEGQIICYKAQIDDSEISQATALKEKLGMSLLSDRKFLLSDKKTARRIFVFEKTGEPTVALPRREGMAQKRPYIA